MNDFMPENQVVGKYWKTTLIKTTKKCKNRPEFAAPIGWMGVEALFYLEIVFGYECFAFNS